MKILIQSLPNRTVGVSKDLREGGTDKGLLAHVILELERIRDELKENWKRLN